MAEAVRAEPDPHTGRMTALVEELLRRDGPMLTAIRRFPVEDLWIGETTVPAGDTVLLALASANRDAEQLADPESTDLDRQADGHLGFGQGLHYCLGAPLARMEVRIALWTLLHRLPDVKLAVPHGRLDWKPDHRQHALAALPVEYAPRPAR